MTADVVCANCAAPNRPDRKFCRSCGRPLASGCPACGAQNDAGDRFCGTCGTGLPGAGTGTAEATGPGSQGPASTRPTERRLVSVLFADLVGSTTLADGRDPEAVRETLSDYFAVARERIERYGGTIEKFIGDAVMAVWGTPRAREDDAERAVRAALDLVEAVRSLPAGTGEGDTLAARVAVMTGETAVDPSAVGQGMVTGDLVNAAARLQGAAEPGTVLVGEATVRAAERAIAFEPVGGLTLKGISEAVPAWKAVRVVSGIGGARRASRLEPPFVGRDEELHLLKEQFHATARDGRARLVSILGIAGIGKSRLAWEFFKYIDGIVGDVYWHEGRSPAYGEGVAFWALGEMVRGRAGILEGDDRATSSAKLDAMLAEHLEDPNERSWAGPRIAALLGLDEMPPGSPDETFAAWRTLFERIAERGPVVMVFEDLHWAEAGLVSFIETILSSSRQRPILVVALARPELLDRYPTWGAGVRRLTSLDLGPIDDDAMELLLVGLVPGIPPDVIEAIRTRSEGVPLYAVETVRMLLDAGTLTERDGRYRLAGSLGRLAVPDSLAGLISARLDALPEPERETLGWAAVLGHVFAADALAVVRAAPVPDVSAHLGALVAREMLEIDDDARSPTRGQYRFVQGLAREVVYGRLSKRERVARHLAAAELFAASETEELSGVVASHYMAAYESAPEGEADRLRASARGALLDAAVRARALAAPMRAMGYLEQALPLADDDDDRARIEVAILEAGIEASRNDVVVARARAVREAAEQRGDRTTAVRAAFFEGQALIHDGQTLDARAVLEGALAAAGGTATDEATARLAAELGRAHLMTGDSRHAFEVVEATLPVAEHLDLRAVIAELLASKGWALSEAGRLHEAAAIFTGAVALAEREGIFHAEARARMNLSAWFEGDDSRRAFEIARIGYERAVARGALGWMDSLFGNAAGSAMSAGEWAWIDEVVATYEPDYSRGISPFFAMGTVIPFLAACGRLDEARAAMNDFVAAVGDRSDPQIHRIIVDSRGFIQLASGDPQEAFAILREAMGSGYAGNPTTTAELLARAAAWRRDRAGLAEALEALRAAPFALIHSGAALVRSFEAAQLAIAREDERAAAMFDEAIAALEAAGAPWVAAQARVDRAFVLPDHPGTPASNDAARAVLERLGARAWLARLDEAEGRDPDNGTRPTAPRTEDVATAG